MEVTWALIVESWKLSHPDKIRLLDVVHNVQPHRADRRVRPGRRLLRADRPRNGRMQQAAGDLPAIESNLALGSDHCGYRGLD